MASFATIRKHVCICVLSVAWTRFFAEIQSEQPHFETMHAYMRLWSAILKLLHRRFPSKPSSFIFSNVIRWKIGYPRLLTCQSPDNLVLRYLWLRFLASRIRSCSVTYLCWSCDTIPTRIIFFVFTKKSVETPRHTSAIIVNFLPRPRLPK